MARFNKLIAIILSTLCTIALANHGETKMDKNEILVIKYDYPQAQVLKESTVKLHQNSKYSFHGETQFSVNILGEKNTILISNLSESFLHYNLDNQFSSVTLYFEPRTHWTSLADSIEKIKKVRETLNPIAKIAKNSSGFELNKLNLEYFKSKKSQLINEYELEHYSIFFIIKKLNTPQEIHPRDEDYFQLIVRVDNKNI